MIIMAMIIMAMIMRFFVLQEPKCYDEGSSEAYEYELNPLFESSLEFTLYDFGTAYVDESTTRNRQ